MCSTCGATTGPRHAWTSARGGQPRLEWFTLAGKIRCRQNDPLGEPALAGADEGPCFARKPHSDPYAPRSRPEPPAAEHDALLYFLADAPWRDRPVRRVAALWARWPATQHGPVRCAILDDTGLL